VDGGARWLKLGGAPTISFRDVVIQEREGDLVCASFGRGLYVLDDYSALRDVSEEALGRPALLFPARRAWWYVPQRVLGDEEKGSLGSAYFTAPNPPFGAVFTWHLAEAPRSTRETRREAEKKLIKDGADTPYPGWEALRAERLEDEPAILLTVRDMGGAIVRTIRGPVSPGIQRAAWDLHYPGYAAETDGKPDQGEEAVGVLAPPGHYTVELAQRVDGVTTMLAGPEPFEVAPLRPRGLPGLGADELAAYLRDMSVLQRELGAAEAVLDEAGARLDAIRTALDRANHGDAELYATAVALEKRLEILTERLRGDRVRGRLNADGPLPIGDRLETGRAATWGTTYGPTLQQRQQLEIGRGQFAAWKGELREIVDGDLRRLGEALDAAGVPWTAGRGW
jgi:hypothetical protein